MFISTSNVNTCKPERKSRLKFTKEASPNRWIPRQRYKIVNLVDTESPWLGSKEFRNTEVRCRRKRKRGRTDGEDDEAGDQQERCHLALEVVENGSDGISDEDAQRDAAEHEPHDLRPLVLFLILRRDQRHPGNADARGGNALDASREEEHFVSLPEREHCNSCRIQRTSRRLVVLSAELRSRFEYLECFSL